MRCNQRSNQYHTATAELFTRVHAIGTDEERGRCVEIHTWARYLYDGTPNARGVATQTVKRMAPRRTQIFIDDTTSIVEAWDVIFEVGVKVAQNVPREIVGWSLDVRVLEQLPEPVCDWLHGVLEAIVRISARELDIPLLPDAIPARENVSV